MDPMFILDWTLGLVTLTALEVVLGIDNIILLSILVSKLPLVSQARARFIGLALALVARVVFLTMAVWLTHMTDPLFQIFQQDISLRDLILIFGGLFLLAKATTEIFHFVEARDHHPTPVASKSQFWGVMGQIVVFDLIFSFDSVLTAVGLAKDLTVMILAVVLAILFMMVFAKAIGEFVDANPTIKLLALSFLVMIGVLLMAEGLDSHFDRGYIYFAMAFSLLIEVLNKRRQKKARSAS